MRAKPGYISLVSPERKVGGARHRAAVVRREEKDRVLPQPGPFEGGHDLPHPGVQGGDGGGPVEGPPPPHGVVLGAAVHLEVGGGRLHDGEVGRLVGHVEEQGGGGGAVVTQYPRHGRPDTGMLETVFIIFLLPGEEVSGELSLSLVRDLLPLVPVIAKHVLRSVWPVLKEAFKNFFAISYWTSP